MTYLENLIQRKLDKSVDKLREVNQDIPSFLLTLNGSETRKFGDREPEFAIKCNSPKGQQSLASMDETRISEAYMAGDLDFEGNILALYKFREVLDDQHL